MWPTLVLSAIALYVIHKILLLLGTIVTAPLVTFANVIYRIYHPPNFPISYYIFNNGLLSMFTFPFEYMTWILLKVLIFAVLLPIDIIIFVVKLVLTVITMLNTVVLSMIMLKLIVAVISVYYFRNLLFKYIPLDLAELKWDISEMRLGDIGTWLTSWN